ncbi:B12-binding domain-containing radical SAM protein [Alphaproteobacteria bacterium]|nr:B12-binding domain-containing radical SAM protein [Alphaproteobacteria bacterium]
MKVNSTKSNNNTDILIIVPPLVDYDSEVDRKAGKPDFENRRLISPIDPTTVSSILLNQNIKVKIFDMGIFTDSKSRKIETISYIEKVKPKYLSIVQSLLTFATASDFDGKFIFNWVRENLPKTISILTGSHATNYPGRAVEQGICDYSLKGEIDFTLPKLIHNLENNLSIENIEGISFIINKEIFNNPDYPKVDVEKLPLPAYHLLDKKHIKGYEETVERGKIRYPQKSRKFRCIMTSRGCILRCSFCSVAHFRGSKNPYRRKSSEMIVDEIEQALSQGIKEIHFFDDLFARSKDEIIEMCEIISKRNVKFDWFVSQGLNLWFLDYETISAMVENGMYRLIAPFESGSDRVLKEVVGKIYSTVEQHHKIVEWSHKLDLQLIGMFVVGLPGEKRSEIFDTLKFAEDHPQIDYNVFSIATPMIGTRLTKKLVSKGVIEDVEKVNKVIKRTVGLYRTDEFSELDLGLIRSYDWDRINFSTQEKRDKYCKMVGINSDELDQMRKHSIETFKKFFSNYSGPKSFNKIYNEKELSRMYSPAI